MNFTKIEAVKFIASNACNKAYIRELMLNKSYENALKCILRDVVKLCEAHVNSESLDDDYVAYIAETYDIFIKDN